MELKLQDNVKIMGLGKPTKILPTGWVYLQVRICSCPKALMCTRLTMHEDCRLLLLNKDSFASVYPYISLYKYLPVWPESTSRHVILLLLLLAELCDRRAACVYIGGWSVRRVRGVH